MRFLLRIFTIKQWHEYVQVQIRPCDGVKMPQGECNRGFSGLLGHLGGHISVIFHPILKIWAVLESGHHYLQFGIIFLFLRKLKFLGFLGPQRSFQICQKFHFRSKKSGPPWMRTPPCPRVSKCARRLRIYERFLFNILVIHRLFHLFISQLIYLFNIFNILWFCIMLILLYIIVSIWLFLLSLL